MDGLFYAALVTAILVFAWAFVRLATLADQRTTGRGQAEWYVVDGTEAPSRGAGAWQECRAVAGEPMVPQRVGWSAYGGESPHAASGGAAWQPPRNPDRSVVWVLPGRTSEPGLLQDELARLKRAGAIRNYYRIVAYPGGSVDHRA